LNKKLLTVLDYLKANEKQYVSGALIGKALNISRSAVWKQIERLRSEGYQIIARSHSGYCLNSGPDHLDQSRLKDNKIVYLKSVESTNLTARKLAGENAPANTTIVAEEQQAGKGRLGRSWFSPKAKGLWFTIILRPELMSPAAANPVTLVTAAVMADYLNTVYGLPARIKWPNDLLLHEKKLAGILTEIKADLDQIDFLLMGIGLNINQDLADFPWELRKKATSIMIETGIILNRTELFLKIHDALIAAYQQFEEEGFAPFRARWLKYNETLGRKVTVKWAGGSLTGIANDLSEAGSLLIRDRQNEIHSVNYGEII
jgi:BirA family transcriptional regulator, biotin operon repressor / biotin---[acetyl-CoA-carboxylase] ligase